MDIADVHIIYVHKVRVILYTNMVSIEKSETLLSMSFEQE